MTFAAAQTLPGLPVLIHPTDTPTFMTGYWRRRSLLRPALDAASDPLVRRLASSSVQELLCLARSTVLVNFYLRNGEYCGTMVPPRQARTWHRAGLPLYFDLAEDRLVSEWLDALARDLHEKRDNIRLSIFASPKGVRTECHFDANENFTIQLRGRKRWRLAPNTEVVNPVGRFTVTGRKSPEMCLYAEQDLRAHPPLSEVADLEPGSMLYVPRGYWHEVEALEDAVSLNFCLKPETWLEYLLPLIERRLLAEAHWRDAADGVRGSARDRQDARRRIGALLAALPAALSELTDEELVPGEGNGKPQNDYALDRGRGLRRNRTALMSWGGEYGLDGDRIYLRIETANGGGVLTLAPELLPLCAWIAEQRELTADAVLERFHDLPRDDVIQLLCRLIASGFLSAA